MSYLRPGGLFSIPVVIKNLMIINALVFFGMVTVESSVSRDAADWISNHFALHYIGSEYFMPHQLVTHLFMHGSFGHLFGNMFTLWIFGSMLENSMGAKRFLTFYMACGVGAALFYMSVQAWEFHQLNSLVKQFQDQPSYETLLDLQRRFHIDRNWRYQGIIEQFGATPNDPGMVAALKVLVSQTATYYQNTALVGASGAIFGILFGAAWMFPNELLYLYFLFPIKIKYFAGVMIILEVVRIVQNNPNDDVAHFAHLGGALFAYLILRGWQRRRH